MENKVKESNVSFTLRTDLCDEAFNRKRKFGMSWGQFFTMVLEQWLGSDAPVSVKVEPDPLDAEALAIRDWLRAADAQPKGSPFKVNAGVIRTMVKVAIPEPLPEPHTPASGTEHKGRRVKLNPTEEPA